MGDEQEKGGEPYITRRAESLDSERVAQLIKRQTESVFGRLNTDDIIEKANLAITLAGKEDQVLAFAAFYDYPFIENVEQSKWEVWLSSVCQCPYGNPLNSLFLRLFVAQDGYSQGALTELLRTVFVAVPLLQYIFLPVIPGTNIGSILETHFSLLPSCNDSPSSLIYVTQRHQHYPMLHVRQASVEDNDDLMPVLQQYAPGQGQLASQYGDYFIAELIESQDDNHHTVVAEVNGRAVGLMSVTSDINLSVLWECYQLEPFHGLRKPCDEDTITTTHDGSEKVSYSSFKQNTPPPSKSPQESSAVSIVEVEEKKDDETEHTIQQTEQSSLSSIKNETSIQSSVISAQFDEQSSSSYHDKIYSFHGPSNAVSVQLFCMDEQYEMRSIDLIPAIFEIFPDRDFLILSQPHNILEFPLLQHFTHVTPRLDSTISQDLYILHKCSLLNSFHVHPMEEKDIKGVSDLTSSLDAQNDIMIDVERYLEGGRDPLSENATPLHVFVAECLEQIVGVVILRQEENLEYLRSHYNIEDYVYYSQHTPQEHMTVHHLLINPIFAPHLKHFMKEAMRLTHSNNLYYPVPLHDLSRSHPHSLTLALGEMVPIRPRRQVYYPDDLGINVPCSGVMEEQPLYTLYHTNRKLSIEPKIVINSCLVFIGASDASLAALETLVFSPHLRFNNLILVSPNGLPDSSYSSVLPNSCCFYNGALSGTGLEVWVNVVKGVLTAIKRESREINVLMSDKSDESILPYDYLILSTGLQYCFDEPGHGDIPEKGVFTLQGDSCDEKVLEKTKELIANNGKVVVYGSSIASLSLLAHLLDMMKVPGPQMTWIQPHPFTVMKDSIFSDKIQDGVDTSGMNVIQGYKIEKYESFDGELTGLMCVNEEKGETISLDCRVVFCLETREVDKRAFKAINDSCLVYDNRVVIDSQHFTNDTHILAMGSVTKYSRHYRTQWSHDHFNASEVGQKLAATILSKLDPTLHPLNTPPQDKYLIPIYSQPKILYTRLPGGLYYLQIEKPHFDEIKEPNEGMEVFTNTENGYFRLYINQYERIQTITILSHKVFEVSNYMCLYNIHEKYLNNLLSRWKENLINDLFIYFREQWTCAIFHDRFTDFTSEVKELLSEPQGEEPSLMDKTKDIIDDSAVVSVEANCEKFLSVSNDLEKVMNKRLHRYIHHNGYHLPMYAHPDML